MDGSPFVDGSLQVDGSFRWAGLESGNCYTEMGGRTEPRSALSLRVGVIERSLLGVPVSSLRACLIVRIEKHCH